MTSWIMHIEWSNIPAAGRAGIALLFAFGHHRPGRMKTGVVSVLPVILACVCLGCSHTVTKHRSSAATATVVVERPENEGSVNIVRCTVVFSTGHRIELGGGENTTVTVPAGSVWVEASSIHPYRYSEPPNPRAWLSRRMNMRLRPGEVVRLLVEPRSRGSTYIGGWTIKRMANERSALDARTALCLHVEAHWPGASESGCSA